MLGTLGADPSWSIDPNTWAVAIITLVGALVGSASAAWFLGKMAGREFREAVIKEVAGIKAKTDDLEARVAAIIIESRERDKEITELGKIAAKLEAIVNILAGKASHSMVGNQGD
jgi:hypothetical protein